MAARDRFLVCRDGELGKGPVGEVEDIARAHSEKLFKLAFFHIGQI